MNFQSTYRGQRVLVTGATGFKGAWLAAWLRELGAEVHGYSLPPTHTDSLYSLLDLERRIAHRMGDLRDAAAVDALIREVQPSVIFHLAAQSLVRPSYADPVGTFATNVMGTANVLDAVRRAGIRTAIVVVTSDKCYQNLETDHAYEEGDALGGWDPYSASKGAAEIVAASYRQSFFHPDHLDEHGVAMATARAGNVIGGGDRAVDRLVPDVIAALDAGRPIPVRNPRATRPWQHVLEPLAGYLELGARLLGADARAACGPWNFGPEAGDAQTVERLVTALIAAWGSGSWSDVSNGAAPHEAHLLRLSIDKATTHLSWRPRWSFDETILHTVEGYQALRRGDVDIVTRQIAQYTAVPQKPMNQLAQSMP